MPVDFVTETVGGLSEAAEWCPPINGRRPDRSTIWRWIKLGIKGVRLEHSRLGNRILTSREAINRFTQRLAEVDSDADTEAAPRPIKRQRSRTPEQAQRAQQQANADLSAVGIRTDTPAPPVLAPREGEC